MLLVDGRFSVSGIGVYVERLKKTINQIDSVKIDCPIYSVKEHFFYSKYIPTCDLYWSPHWNIPLLPIRAKKRMVTIHDVYHLAFSDQFSFVKRLYAKFMISQAVKRSDIILTVSEFSKQEIIKYTGCNKDIHVVYNGIGVDPSLYSNELGSPSVFPYILYVGNVKPHKNLSRALAAFERLSSEHINLRFVIVGKKDNFITGDDKFIQKALDNDRVVFTGYVDDKKLVGYYKFAELLFFPSLYEGFGLPPLEAQACGIACLVSNAASLPEICADSVLYCDPYSVEDMAVQLETLLSDQTLRDDLVARGFENIKRFSWEKSAQQIINIIEESK